MQDLQQYYFIIRIQDDILRCKAYFNFLTLITSISIYNVEQKNLLMMQYLFDGEEHEVTPAPHGHAKSNHATSYIRTKPSVIEKIKEVAKTTGPRATFHQISSENGGYLQASSASDLPRNREQVKNFRWRVRPKKSKSVADSLVILLQECKRQQLNQGKDLFIRDVTAAPELRCILVYDWQLKQIEQFCTDPRHFSVFSADPTFNLGNFNLTVTTYRHLKVVTRRDNHHPIMLGPLLISQSKSSDAYDYFFGKITSLNKRLKNVLAIGTDGEEALISGMKNSMSYAIHLRCFGHFRDNCKQQLRQSNIPEAVQNTFLDDVFGKWHGETFEKGICTKDV